MSSQKETLTLSLSKGTKEKLEAIARKFKIFWGKSPSPSGLITAIADGDLEVGEPFSFQKLQVESLHQATKLLIDAGYVGESEIISRLLLERGNLSPEHRQELLKQMSQGIQPWRNRIDELKEQEQPFLVLYTNSQGKDLELHVQFAEINFHERRFYLDIWCEETEDIPKQEQEKFPELMHNRCLRLDRIKLILPYDSKWREEGLGYIDVHFQFTGGMVKAYERKENDLHIEKQEKVTNVIRRVTNLFWFFREIIRYDKDCVIISPENVRVAFQEKINSLQKIYGER